MRYVAHGTEWAQTQCGVFRALRQQHRLLFGLLMLGHLCVLRTEITEEQRVVLFNDYAEQGRSVIAHRDSPAWYPSILY